MMPTKGFRVEKKTFEPLSLRKLSSPDFDSTTALPGNFTFPNAGIGLPSGESKSQTYRSHASEHEEKMEEDKRHEMLFETLSYSHSTPAQHQNPYPPMDRSRPSSSRSRR